MMFLFLIILIMVVYYLFYNTDKNSNLFNKNNSAQELLKERFIRGEIDEKTYLRMKETIK